jgi:hypothetical protein
LERTKTSRQFAWREQRQVDSVLGEKKDK